MEPSFFFPVSFWYDSKILRKADCKVKCSQRLQVGLNYRVKCVSQLLCTRFDCNRFVNDNFIDLNGVFGFLILLHACLIRMEKVCSFGYCTTKYWTDSKSSHTNKIERASWLRGMISWKSENDYLILVRQIDLYGKKSISFPHFLILFIYLFNCRE